MQDTSIGGSVRFYLYVILSNDFAHNLRPKKFSAVCARVCEIATESTETVGSRTNQAHAAKLHN